eukprot:2234730-Ditylum_brightwellii.AAC.1
MEEIEEGEYAYETIMDHRFENGSLKLKVKYYNAINGKDNIVEVPFNIMKKDEPVSLAKYIKRYVMESSRQEGTFNVWATKVLRGNNWRENGIKEKETANEGESPGHKGVPK